jgi:hypothetical protein
MRFNNSGKGALWGDIYWSPTQTWASPLKNKLYQNPIAESINVSILYENLRKTFIDAACGIH